MASGARSIGSSYRPDIDGLRAVAVLSVMAYHLHAPWLPGGFVGVDVFFVISGYVVTSSLATSNHLNFFAFIGEFYARRLARILPALTVVIIVSALLSTLFVPHAWLSQFSEKTALFALFGLSNWVMQNNSDTYFAPRAEFNPYTHTWSLGVEEQFYLLAPLLVYLWIFAFKRNLRGLATLSTTFFAVACLLSLALAIQKSASSPEVAFYSIGARFWELGSGALLFMLSHRNIPVSKFRRSVFSNHIYAWLGIFLFTGGFVFTDARYFPWPWALPAVLGTLLLIYSGANLSQTPIHRLLSFPVILWIGKRSYSIYLWHWPIFVLMRWTSGLHTPWLFATAAGLSIVLAAVSYRVLELPLRHNPRIEGWPKLRRIAFFLGFPVIGFFITSHLFNHHDRYSLSIVSKDKIDWYASGFMARQDSDNRLCKVDIKFNNILGGQEFVYLPSDCGGFVTPKKMWILGDSHATAYSATFERLSAELGMQVSLFTFPGCPYLNLIQPQNALSPGCVAFAREASRRILAEGKKGDMVFLASLRIHRYGDQWANANVPDMFDKMFNPDAQRYRDEALIEAKEWLAPFSENGLKVFFEAPIPIYKAPPFRCSDWFNKDNPICVGQNQQPRLELERLRAPVIRGMQQLAQDIPEVGIWDPFPVLCPDEICFAVKEGRPLFFDGDHLSAFGNVTVYPYFKHVVIEALSQ